MFDELEQVMEKLKRDTRIIPKEIIFCNIFTFYGRARLPTKALQVFDQIPSFRCERTIRSVNSLLDCLLICGEFEKMSEIFMGIEKLACPDVCTYNILINASRVRGDLCNAQDTFDVMLKKGIVPNVVTFGTLINGLCANSQIEEAFRLKKMMERDYKLRPNAFVYVALIKALCKGNDLDSAIKLKEEMMRKNVELDSAVYATLISALFKVGRREDVLELLNELGRNSCQMNKVIYNAMIHGYCMQKDFDSAFGMLTELEGKRFKPDVISYNVIIRGLCLEGKLREASELFEDMPRRKCFPDVVTYRTLFDGLCDGMQLKEAALILDEMVFKGHLPRSSSISKLVDGLIQGEDTNLLWMVLNSLVKGKFSDVHTWRMMISVVLEEDRLSNSTEILDSLITRIDDALSVV